MCGIADYIDERGVDRARHKAMTATLSHRGPDNEGMMIDDRVAFGHRRLAIIDLSAGQQPMSNEDGSCWITFDNEIYNVTVR